MRRWNGWGDDTVLYPLSPAAESFLVEQIGAGTSVRSAGLREVLASIPDSRLPENSMFTTDPEQRLRHARGQSLPDWIALRTGSLNRFPDAVAFPENNSDVAGLIQYARQNGTRLIPYGGGTSVVGHINPTIGDRPVLTVNMRRINGLRTFNEQDLLATFGAGVSGPELEAQLRARGFTLGHYPQSFEYSTLGGWIATRSKGQQALLYGRIEDLYAGGRLLTPAGELILPPHPASAAGPDLRHLILGSEGRMGFITEAAVKVSMLPEVEEFNGLFFPDFSSGQTAVREMVQSKLPLSMLRLSTHVETETTLVMAGHERAIGLVGRYLNLRGVSQERALLLVGLSGSGRIVSAARKEAFAIAKRNGGILVGKQFGDQWLKSRFRSPYLRNTLWEKGYAVDTIETAVPWHRVDEMLVGIENAIRNAIEPAGERVLVFSHLSHLYSSGASVYVTYIFRLADDAQETLARWQAMKTAASNVIVAGGGTISHQHGVGLDHIRYLVAEKGKLGVELINDALRRADPGGIMNPGKLIDAG